MSSFIVNAFSKVKTKSMPLNPHSVASDDDSFDDFEPDSSALNTSSSLSSSSLSSRQSFSTSAQEASALLPKTGRKKAVQEQRLEKARKFGMAFIKFAASTAASHFIPGSGGLFNLPAAGSTASHIAGLKQLLDEECDVGQSNVCQGLLSYALNQKNRKLNDALAKCTPGIGTAAAINDKIHWADKKIVGDAGGDRFAEARLLVDHAKVCHVALAIYAELVYGDLTSKKAFRKALHDVESEDLEWGLSDEDPVEKAVNKAASKLKPV